MYPLLFKPNLKTVVWGGEKLTVWKGLDRTPNIGESWEVSAIPGSESVIANGEFEGRRLTDLIEQFPTEILGRKVVEDYGKNLPLLVKFIDAQRDLSIQVHPDDEMASRMHGKRGKTEMWYVIDAEPGAYLYAGFSKELTREQYKLYVESGAITEALARHEVHSGDVFYLPAGRVHAICGGIILAEVQQSSDVTYRIYDYDRPGLDGKPRELHTELAAQALDFTVYDEYRTNYDATEDAANYVVRSPYFSVKVEEVNGRFHRKLIKYDSFIISMCLKGDCIIKVRESGEEIVLKEGNSCLIPAAIADYDIIPLDGKSRVLDAYVDNMDRSFASKLTRFLHITKK